MKNYDLLKIKRTYGFLGCKTKIGQVWFRTIRPRWQPYGKILENRENTKPIWQGKGKKDEMGTRWYIPSCPINSYPPPPTRWQIPSFPINSPRGGISLRALLTPHEVADPFVPY